MHLIVIAIFCFLLVSCGPSSDSPKYKFEQFISNFTNTMEQGNGSESIAGRPSESEPVKAGSLVRSVIVSELKKKIEKKQNQSEKTLKSLNYS